MTLAAADLSQLERRVVALEAENLALNERALGAENRLIRAAQLYASVSELHQAADTDEVVTIIKEIVANLLGCEEMGVYDVWNPGPVCTYVDGIGIDPSRFGSLPPTHALVRAAVGTRRVIVTGDVGAEPIHGSPVSALVPLVDGEATCGLIVLFSLLRQKSELDAGDLDLLEALGLHAGRALLNARLREQRA